jgi:hypothetical protein
VNKLETKGRFPTVLVKNKYDSKMMVTNSSQRTGRVNTCEENTDLDEILPKQVSKPPAVEFVEDFTNPFNPQF